VRRLLRLLVILRRETLSVYVPEHLQCLPLLMLILIPREQPCGLWYML
jgi:hypothetical protein